MDDIENELNMDADDDGFSGDEIEVEDHIKRQVKIHTRPRIRGHWSSISFIQSNRKCLNKLQEAMLRHQWMEAAGYFSSFIQTLDAWTIREVQSVAAEILWRLGTEILHHLPNTSIDDYNVFYEQLKNFGVKNFTKICLEQSFHLLLNGQVDEAKRQLTVAQSWRFGRFSTAQALNQKLISAHCGFLEYLIWYQKKNSVSDNEVPSSSHEMHTYFRQASVTLKEIISQPGVWDPFVLSYVHMLEFYNDVDSALQVLENYAYNKEFPSNPNSHLYLYQFLKRHDAPLPKLINVLRVLQSVVPSHELNLELCKHLLKTGKKRKMGEALTVIMDLLEFSCWKSDFGAWKLLLGVLQTMKKQKQQDVVSSQWSIRRSLWLPLHFTPFIARKDLKENPRLLKIKSQCLKLTKESFRGYLRITLSAERPDEETVQKKKKTPGKSKNKTCAVPPFSWCDSPCGLSMPPSPLDDRIVVALPRPIRPQDLRLETSRLQTSLETSLGSRVSVTIQVCQLSYMPSSSGSTRSLTCGCSSASCCTISTYERDARVSASSPDLNSGFGNQGTVATGHGSAPSLTSSSVKSGIRVIHPNELAMKLTHCPLGHPLGPIPVIIDCRPFLEFNKSHIKGAVHINCSDKISRRRLQQGKITVLDLISCKDAFRGIFSRELVVYDEGTLDPGRLVPSQAMHVVLESLRREGKEPLVLKGGLSCFRQAHAELCEDSLHPDASPDGLTLASGSGALPLSLPSTPDIEGAELTPVLPFLHLGNERDAQDLDLLRQRGIGFILNVTTQLPLYHQQLGIFSYRRLPASDSSRQNLRMYFEEAFEFIEEAHQSGHGILVHCQAGVSRSATIVIAYLMKRTWMSMTDAYKFVKSRRPIISPNLSFMGQLLEFEEDLNNGVTPRILSPKLSGLETVV
ncbi:hypothetical protein DNTS_034822 [Danionella cerebrum]|uniref:Dual specificity protein phosphatase 10 n=1 Tax=Danionella cerebrum TaxID=2873325 RepID=A0A553MLS4_9TELE|nr:hypothetical protein DNTS_034822 [Danionella translucida]